MSVYRIDLPLIFSLVLTDAVESHIHLNLHLYRNSSPVLEALGGRRDRTWMTQLWMRNRHQSVQRHSRSLLVRLKKPIPGLPLQQAKPCLPPHCLALSETSSLELRCFELLTRQILRSLHFHLDISALALAVLYSKGPLVANLQLSHFLWTQIQAQRSSLASDLTWVRLRMRSIVNRRKQWFSEAPLELLNYSVFHFFAGHILWFFWVFFQWEGKTFLLTLQKLPFTKYK